MISLLRNRRNWQRFWYISHHIKSLDNTFFGIGLLVKFVMRQSLRKTTNNLVPRAVPPLRRKTPRRLRFTNIAALTSQPSILFIETCLPSTFKSWLCGPVKWLTEETTNQFKSNAGSYLRVKNRSIGRDKKKLSDRSREPTHLSQTIVEGRIEPGQR